MKMNTWITEKGTKVQLVYVGASNVYLVSNRDTSFLVDTAMSGTVAEVVAGIVESKAPEPSLLVLTHTHYDHAGAAAALKEKYDLKIAVHRHDSGFLETGDSPFPEGTTLGTKAFMAIMRLPGELVVRYPGVKADIAVEDEYSLAEYGFDAKIVHTPGHSEGALSVIIDGEIAIVGDALYGLAHKSIVSPFLDDKEKLFESLCFLYDSGCQIFLSGHGTAIPRERLDAQIADLVRRRERKTRTKGENYEDS